LDAQRRDQPGNGLSHIKPTLASAPVDSDDISVAHVVVRSAAVVKLSWTRLLH